MSLIRQRHPHRYSHALRAHVSGLPFAAACVVLTASCGSDHAATTADGATLPNCTASPETLNPSLLIDDFEDGNSAIATVAGRVGGWFSYGDPTAGGRIEPLGNVAPELIAGGRGAVSQRALHITTSGFLDWGSGVTTAFHWGPNAAGVASELPYEAQRYQGVTFFARLGDTSGATVRIQFEDQYARPEAGLCVDGGPPGQGCYDGFGIELPALTTSWQAYRISFADLSQRTFGIPRPSLDTTNLYDIQFLFPGGAVTDLWVDDIRFFE